MRHRPVSLGKEELGRAKVSEPDGERVLSLLGESGRLGF
jgi:hypothetical protein